ncbi:hypothetical protein B0H11DRAFT_1935911 [Mycena galericulata]|nr:hypothetical protein B0H11DRAFT_1935911 [Mycena galericulata]
MVRGVFPDGTFDDMGPYSVRGSHKPTIAASVAYHWRDIALNTAEFWSSFRIDFHSYNCLHRLRLCLERSKQADLSICLDWRTPDNPNPPYPMNRDALDEALNHAERWGCIATPIDPQFLRMLSSVQGRLHRLESIIYDLHGGAVPGHEQLLTLRIFEDAPSSLRSVRYRAAPESAVGLPPLPWHQLQRVFLDFQVPVPVNDPEDTTPLCIQVLEMMPNLRTITIRSFQNGEMVGTAVTPSASPHLQEIILLGIEGNRELKLMEIFDHMNTPEVKSIVLVSCSWCSPNILSLVHRSECYLQQLELDDIRVRAPELLELLRTQPTLGTLVMTNCTPNAVTNVLFEALTPSATSIILPALNTFVLGGFDYLFSTDKLLRMLEGRTGVHDRCSSLTTIDIVLGRREVAAYHLQQFVELRRGADRTRLRCLDESRAPVELITGPFNGGFRENEVSYLTQPQGSICISRIPLP